LVLVNLLIGLAVLCCSRWSGSGWSGQLRPLRAMERTAVAIGAVTWLSGTKWIRAPNWASCPGR